MYTQCPQCRTHFRVRSEHLRAAGGNVRCSLCHHTFNALESLSESLPASARTADPPELKSTDSVGGEHPGDRTSDMFEQLAGDTDQSQADETADHPAEDEASLSDLGSLAPRKRPMWHTVAWSAGAATLALTLGAQLVHAHRDDLSRHPAIGPWLKRAYEALDMPQAGRENLFRFRIHRTQMLAPPARPGTLELTGVLRNTAEFEQRLPHLYVRVEDRWGRRVGHRYARPAAYLPEADRGLAALAPGAEIGFRVALRDPGSDAVGFNLQPCRPRGNAYLCASEFRPPGK